MQLKKLEEYDIENKTVLYRAPYDIEVEEINGKFHVKDDLRIRATLPTLQFLLSKNCRIVILTYVGRPDSRVVESLRTEPHARKLSELLGMKVDKVDDCVGPDVNSRVRAMKPREILMLENVRFHKGEMPDDDGFATELCKDKDVVVFDGFPQAHREHASTTGIMRHLPAVAGFYVRSEVEALSRVLENPKRPFTVIIGGAKISDKVDAVNNLLNIADRVLVAGAVANVFLRAEGVNLGKSFVEDVFVDEKRREKKDWVVYAGNIIKNYKDKIAYPEDLVVFDGEKVENMKISPDQGIPESSQALDIGEETRKKYSEIIKSSGLVFLAGPIGKFEDFRFSVGTKEILKAMAETTAETIVAGGDTIDSVVKYGDISKYTYTSLAGGATLDFLAGKELPALKALL